MTVTEQCPQLAATASIHERQRQLQNKKAQCNRQHFVRNDGNVNQSFPVCRQYSNLLSKKLMEKKNINGT